MIRIKVVNSSKATGAIAARWQAKAGVEPPFAGRWKLFFLGARIFYKVIFRCNCSPGTVARDCLLLRFHKAGRSCSPRLEKLSLFSPPPPCAKSMAQEIRCLRAAIRATRPEPRQHFWKIVGSKNFLFACGLWLKTLLLGKPSESGSARLGHIPSLPWESQLPPKPCSPLQPSAFEGNCDSFDLLLDFCYSFICKFDLLRKCGLLAHTSAAFLKNCCTEKLFGCLRQKNCRQFELAATSFDLFFSYFI